MDAEKVWEAIRNVVESGNEDDKADLKSEWYDLGSKSGKVKFLKHICAMANSLSGHGDRRYIVLGVLDAKHCQDRTDAANYIVGVQPGDVDTINQTISHLVSEYIDPPCDLHYLEIPQPELNRTVGALEIRGWLGGWDERPYVIAKGIAKDIDRLCKGQVFVRRAGSVSEPASWTDIRLLVNHAQEQRIESLEMELEELRQSAEEELGETVTQLQRDHKESVSELLDEISDLRSDKARLSNEGEEWMELARMLCRRVHRRLGDTDRNWLRRQMRRRGKKIEFDSWTAS